jgi:hypothetical protein
VSKWSSRGRARRVPCSGCKLPGNGERPRLPEVYRTQFDKQGWRHQRSGTGRAFDDPIAAPGRAEACHLARRGELHHQAWSGTRHGMPGHDGSLPLVVDHCSPTMFAHIGVMRATDRHVERAFNPVRSNRLGGKRKLACDRGHSCLRVPELTRCADIQLNKRVLLRRRTERIPSHHRTISPSGPSVAKPSGVILRLAALLYFRDEAVP